MDAALEMATQMFKIETRSRNEYGDWSEWHRFVGDDNEFETEDEATGAIESMRQLGDDWKAAEYRVTA